MLEYYDSDKKEELEKEIRDMRSGSYEEMWLITVYGLSSYFKSLFSFGFKSNVTKDNINVIKEMFNILFTERKMLNFMLKNLDKFHLNSTADVIKMLDELNDKTVEYYYHIIEDIETACECGQEFRGTRPRKDFPTLTQSDSYASEVVALSLNKKSIREFLGYEEEFWKFIEGKDNCDIKVSEEAAKAMAYAIPLSNGDNIVHDVKFMIPEVVDLSTALLAIQTYQKVYALYKRIGMPIVREEINKEKTEQFEIDYLPRLSQVMIHKKKQS
jgi:hypothetical protein